MKVITSPNDLALEKACIQKTQAAVAEMQNDLAGLEMLNRMQTRLEAQIADVVAALECITRLRGEVWAKQHEDFDRGKSLSDVERMI